MSFKFLPPSFERRGVALPFERKILRFARLRIDDPEDQGRWQVILPNHGTSRRGAVAIMPWRQLPNFTDLGPRDQAMVAAIARMKVPPSPDPAIDPLALRHVVLGVDSEFASTPQRQAAARRDVAMDGIIRSTMHLHLFANLVQEFARDVSDEVLTNMTGALYRQLSSLARKDPSLRTLVDRFATKVVQHAATRLGMSPDHMMRRMNDLADIVVPLGKVDVEDVAAAIAMGQGADERVQDGFLIRQRNDLRWLYAEMEAYLVNAREELRYPVEMILFSIDQFLKVAVTPIDEVERDISRIGSALQRYDLVRPRVASARMAVAWTMDGWTQMVEVWREALDFIMKHDLDKDGKMQVADVIELERAVTTIFQNMPTMPTCEIDAIRDRLEAWTHFETARVKMVQSGCDWSANRPDEELRQRLAKANPKLKPMPRPGS